MGRQPRAALRHAQERTSMATPKKPGTKSTKPTPKTPAKPAAAKGGKKK